MWANHAPRVALSTATAAAISLLACAPAFATPLPTLLARGSSNTFELRPVTITTSGDGGELLGALPSGSNRGALSWRTWNRHQAQAVGYTWSKDCNPDCAAGSLEPFPARVTATAPQDGHFTHLTIVAEYQSGPVTTHFVLHHAHGFYEWFARV